jgi:hypothetical protein
MSRAERDETSKQGIVSRCVGSWRGPEWHAPRTGYTGKECQLHRDLRVCLIQEMVGRLSMAKTVICSNS